MALPQPAGLTPAETTFLCEMESVTVVPRQRLDSLKLLGGPTPSLRPPHRTTLPLWLALLLKRQRRASIAPPPWLHPEALQEILDRETATSNKDAFTPHPPLPSADVDARNPAPGPLVGATPPFHHTSTADGAVDALPYHYLELAHLLLTHCGDDIPDFEQVQRLLRDLREVRMSKVRAPVPKLEGGAGVDLSGVGALELGESRLFLSGVVDGLRKLGASREVAIRERLEEEGQGLGGQDEGDDMDL